MAGANNAVETLAHLVAKAQRGLVDSVRDNAGNTPLHAAAAQGCYEACEYLLKASSDPLAPNNRGHIPQDAATTPRFALANDLNTFALSLFLGFRSRQVRPRLLRFLKSTKPSLGFYPGRLLPHVALLEALGAAFVVGA
jgi:hypothetical protein